MTVCNATRTMAIARRSFLDTARKPTWWLLVLLIVLVSCMISRFAAPLYIPAQEWVSPKSASALIVGNTIIATVLMVPVATFVFGLRIVRDRALGINGLLIATGLRPAEQVVGHAIAASALVAAALLAIFFACIVAAEAFPYRELEATSDFGIGRYVVPALLMLWLPTYAAGAIAMAVAATTGRASAVVFCWLPIFGISCISDWNPDWLPAWVDHALVVVDITGSRWFDSEFFRVNRGAEFYNATPVGTLMSSSGSYFALNRLMAAAAVISGILVAALAHARACRPRNPMSASAASQAVAESARLVSAATSNPAAFRISPSGCSQVSMAVAIAGSNARAVVSRPGLWCWVVITALVALLMTTNGDSGTHEGVEVSSSGTLMTQAHPSYLLMALLLTASAVVGLMDRGEAARRDAIVEQTPVSNGALAVGRMAACLVPITMLLASVFPVIIAARSLQGSTDPVTHSIDPWPVLLWWGVLILPSTLFVLSALTLGSALFRTTQAVLVIAAGLITTAVLLPIFRGAATPWWCDWSLLSAPAWSDLAPLQPDRGALLTNRAMVLALAMAMASMAIRTWPRERLDPASSPSRTSRLLRAAISPTSSVPLVLAIALAIANWYRGQLGFEGYWARATMKQYVEENLLTWARAPQPTLKSVDLSIGLDPAADLFSATASLCVENRHAFGLRSFAFTVSPLWEMELNAVTESPRLLVVSPTGRSEMLLEVSSPYREVALLPGESCTVTFRYSGSCNGGIGLAPRQLASFMVEGGVLMGSDRLDFLPLIGFVPEMIEGSELKPDRHRAGASDLRRGPLWGGGGLIDVTAAVRIPEEYRANLPGSLVSETVEDGWRTLRWKTDRPISEDFHIVAGRWAETKGQRSSVWHSPKHAQNIPSIIEALDAARESYSQWFGDYPWRELRLSEFPGLSDYAQSGDTNIVFSESMGFRALQTDDLDAAFAVTAHEAAHQWWGGQVLPGTGANILSEGLAQYATIRLIGERRGARMQQAFLRDLEEQYLSLRDPSTEEALSDFDDGSPDSHTLLYHRAGWVFWMLAQRMGFEASDVAHRQFVARFADRHAFPVLKDYIDCMRSHVDPRVVDAFSAQWLERRAVAQYAIKLLDCRPIAGGWRTTVQVVDLGATGGQVEVAITNGVARWGAGKGEVPDYRSEVRAVSFDGSDTAQLTVDTAFEAREAIVDPDVKILQVGRAAAVARIGTSSRSPHEPAALADEG